MGYVSFLFPFLVIVRPGGKTSSPSPPLLSPPPYPVLGLRPSSWRLGRARGVDSLAARFGARRERPSSQLAFRWEPVRSSLIEWHEWAAWRVDTGHQP